MHKFFKYICLIFSLIIVFDFGCPFLKFLNIRCTACGVTHAWIYLVGGNVKAAFKSNPMFLPLTVLFLRIVHCELKKERLKGTELAIYCAIAFAASAFNFYRIMKGL